MTEAMKNCELVFGTHVAPGWGCCQSRHYNGLQRESCKVCGHERCAPLTIPSDLKQAIYCEEGGRTKVEIVHSWFEDHKEWKTFNLRLRALESLDGGAFGEIPVGEEFTVNTNVKYAANNFTWRLETANTASQQSR